MEKIEQFKKAVMKEFLSFRTTKAGKNAINVATSNRDMTAILKRAMKQIKGDGDHDS